MKLSKGFIKNEKFINDILKYHVRPYNLGDEGMVEKTIIELVKHNKELKQDIFLIEKYFKDLPELIKKLKRLEKLKDS